MRAFANIINYGSPSNIVERSCALTDRNKQRIVVHVPVEQRARGIRGIERLLLRIPPVLHDTEVLPTY